MTIAGDSRVHNLRQKYRSGLHNYHTEINGDRLNWVISNKDVYGKRKLSPKFDSHKSAIEAIYESEEEDT